MRIVTKPFAGYANFDACVADNKDKADPEAYCASIERRVEEGRKKDKAPDDIPAKSAMVALYPSEDVARLLAITPTIDSISAGIQVEAPEEIHLTLAYYPNVPDEEVDRFIQNVAVCATEHYGTVTTKVEGKAQFFSDDETYPFVLLADPTHLYWLAEKLRGYPGASRKHGFVPHMTIAYVPAGVSMRIDEPPDVPLIFDRISAVIHGVRHDFQIGYPDEVAAVGYRSSKNVDNPPTSNDAAARSQQTEMSQTTGEDDMTVQEKAGKRIGKPWRDRMSGAVEELKKLISWADYEDDDDEADKAYHRTLKMLDTHDSAFSVFKDADNRYRWLAFSSNGFQDKEREIVSTKALEDAVAYGDETGDRGTLRLFHLPGSDHGTCDFQAMVGRFLVESGTFDDSDLGQKALEYYKTTDDELGVSVGFIFHESGFDGRVYTRIKRFKERSVCPLNTVANPWTSFELLTGESEMNAAQTAFLEKVAGPELASKVVQKGESATKVLEASVAFKTDSAVMDALASLETAVSKSQDPEVKSAVALLTKAIGGGGSDPEPTPPEEPAPAPPAEPEEPASKTAETVLDASAMSEFLDSVKALLAPVITANETIVANQTKMSEDITALQQKMATVEAETEKVASKVAPRGAQTYRASGADDNLLEQKTAQELLGENELPASPIAGYLEDLTRSLSRA